MRIQYLIILALLLLNPLATVENTSYNNHSTLNTSPEYYSTDHHLNTTVEGYKVIIRTEGEIKVYSSNITLKVVEIENNTSSPSIFLNHSSKEPYLDILRDLKRENISVLVSYDPSNEEIVVKVLGDKKQLIKEILNKINITSKNIYGDLSYELRIPLNRYNSVVKKMLLKRFNIPEEVLNTSVKTFKINETKIRVEVNNKVDNVWYRFSVKINNSKGYRVKEIVGDDGRVIVNNITVDRETGKVYGDIRYYIENNTLYFYDDPIYGYNISVLVIRYFWNL